MEEITNKYLLKDTKPTLTKGISNLNVNSPHLQSEKLR